MKLGRVWSMPNKWTFECPPIKKFVEYYMGDGLCWADPFCGKNSWAEYRNDLNPEIGNASTHLEATEFVRTLEDKQLGFIFDPPYSPRQVKESYESIGLTMTSELARSSFYSEVKNAICSKLNSGGIVLSFGWNSNGMGKVRGFELLEVLLVSHGGNRNDTICIAEKKL